MTAEKKFMELYKEMYNLCQENGWGDPFSYARAKEIYIAAVLGHRVSETYSGSDGYDEDGEYEYKSTITGKISATYNGISVQNSLQEQIDYITDEKIGKYKKHFCARFDGPEITELYELSGEDVLNLLLPKIIKQFNRKSKKKTKDPRLGVSLTHKEIKTYGKRLI